MGIQILVEPGEPGDVAEKSEECDHKNAEDLTNAAEPDYVEETSDKWSH